MSTKILGNVKRGLAFIISAPAGTGKTTLAQRLTREFPCVVASISCTTRLPRGDEKPGIDYIFMTKQEFEEKISIGDFLEYVNLYGCYYGTSREWVLQQQAQGKHVLLTIDTQGARQLKGNFQAVTIFIKPPSLAELRKRLSERKTETATVVEERLKWAEQEIKAASDYDYNIINDDLNVAYDALRSILIAEEHRMINLNM